MFSEIDEHGRSGKEMMRTSLLGQHGSSGERMRSEMDIGLSRACLFLRVSVRLDAPVQ